MPRFKKVYIEITNTCNLNCSFCSVSSREKKSISVDDFKIVLEKVKAYTDYLYLHVKGEPLLHPQLSDLLDICGHFSFKVNIVSNGILIAKQKELLLKQNSIRQINFSLHCYYELAERKKADYLNDIFTFISKALDETKMYISLRLWNIKELQTEQNNDILNAIQLYFIPDFDLKDLSCTQRKIKIKDRLYLNFDDVFEWPDLIKEVHEAPQFCYALRDQIAILSDGRVVPCCLDGEGVLELGNIFTDSMETILTSSRAKNIYDGFTHRIAVEELCKRCTF